LRVKDLAILGERFAYLGKRILLFEEEDVPPLNPLVNYIYPALVVTA
jgi:hypothetical protein